MLTFNCSDAVYEHLYGRLKNSMFYESASKMFPMWWTEIAIRYHKKTITCNRHHYNGSQRIPVVRYLHKHVPFFYVYPLYLRLD